MNNATEDLAFPIYVVSSRNLSRKSRQYLVLINQLQKYTRSFTNTQIQETENRGQFSALRLSCY